MSSVFHQAGRTGYNITLEIKGLHTKCLHAKAVFSTRQCGTLGITAVGIRNVHWQGE